MESRHLTGHAVDLILPLKWKAPLGLAAIYQIAPVVVNAAELKV